MKKILLILLGTLIALPALARDFEYTYEGQTLTYTVIDEEAKTCSTKSGNYPTPGNQVSGELIIPSKAKDGNVEYTVIEIGDCAFCDCSGLTGNLVLPEGLSSIGAAAFYGCSGLTGNILLPDGLTSIGSYAFFDCSGLTGNLILPEGLTSIEEGAFKGCSGFDGNLILPEELSSIWYYAFEGCSGFTGNLILPEGLSSIRMSAFSGCSGFTGNLFLPEGLTSIGNYAFSGCSGFTGNLILPEGISLIWKVFADCSGLTSVTVGSSVKFIAEKAFSGCSGLTSVYYGADEPIKGTRDIFDDSTYERATLYMSETGAEKGRTIDPWKNFAKIEVYVPTDGIDAVDADIDTAKPYEVYSLSGAKVGNTTESLAPGIYIVRQGNAVKKITVK